MRAVMPSMRQQGSGCIINVSTVAAEAAFAGTGAYAASKAALEQASAVAAIEGRPHGIRVVLVEADAMATGCSPPAHRSVRTARAGRRSATRCTTSARTDQRRPIHAESLPPSCSSLTTTHVPLRAAVGQAAAETLALRRDLGADGWHEFIADAEFAQRYVAPPARS